MKNATRSNLNRNQTRTETTTQATVATFAKFASFEPLEDRRLMSQVSLVDGMLILQGNAHGHNRLSVSPDSGGNTVFARANKVKEHFLLKDIKTIRIVGGETSDNIRIDK